ncbi:MAG: restriction endonuclease subunit S, partial [Lachnospiraceae bacterium]|nr:restriction endonuclease subunit S [Lachnospiraceae bacterium]
DVVNKSFLYKDYLFHLLKSEFFQSFLKEKLAAGAQPNISSKQIEGWTTQLPPIEEQKRIAQAISDVDAVISTTEKLIAKKKALKQGTMQTLLSGKMRIQNGKWIKTTHFKQTELGPIPQEWEVRRLSNLGIFSKGCGISRDESNTGVIPAVRYGELYTTHNDYIKSFTSHISKDVASKARLLKKGDLLFTCSGETKEDIGKCVAFIGDEVAYAGGDLMILTPSININSLFYGFLLNTSIVVKQKSSRAQGDAVVHISSDSIGKILVPFPPQAEQTAIATVLSDMDSEIAALETKLAKYRQLKTGMMQQLLTGKIRLL